MTVSTAVPPLWGISCCPDTATDSVLRWTITGVEVMIGPYRGHNDGMVESVPARQVEIIALFSHSLCSAPLSALGRLVHAGIDKTFLRPSKTSSRQPKLLTRSISGFYAINKPG